MTSEALENHTGYQDATIMIWTSKLSILNYAHGMPKVFRMHGKRLDESLHM